MNTNSCIFCRIIAKELPSYILYEDEHCIGFLDIFPVSRGHTLVLPKRHCEDLHNFPHTDGTYIIHALQIVSNAIMHATGAVGMNVMQNNGAVAGQVIFHLHWHCIPRYVDDGLMLWKGNDTPPKEELQELATCIHNNL